MTVFRFGRVRRCGVGVESLFWCVGWWWVVGFLRYGLGTFGYVLFVDVWVLDVLGVLVSVVQVVEGCFCMFDVLFWAVFG